MTDQGTATEPELTLDEQLAEIQKRRAGMQASEDVLKKKQRILDLTAIADLEEEYGTNRVIAFELDGWKSGEGAATMIAVRLPRGKDMLVKRYEQTVSKTKDGDGKHLDAAHQLAVACVVYPDPKDAKAAFEVTVDLAAAVLSNIGISIVKIVQARLDDEKKG